MNIKEHIKKHQTAYACLSTGIIVAVFTSFVLRNNTPKIIKVDAGNDAVVMGANSVLNQVSYITAERQGPPSWVVRCLETNQIFTSQNAASETMELDRSTLSRHLNGMIEHVNGYHFERICMAA